MATSLVDALRDWIWARPDAIAIDPGLTYAELGERAENLACQLLTDGVRHGDPVALALTEPVDLIVGALGVVMAGGMYLAIDPALPRSRVDLLFEDCPPATVLTALPTSAGRTRLPRLGPDDLACVFFTSGTTGRPKAVPLRHRGVLRLFDGEPPMDLRPGARMAQAAYPMFDAFTLEVWGPLLQGGTIVPVARASLLDPLTLRGTLRAHRIDTLFLTTALLREVVARDPAAFADLDTLFVGGEALDPQSARAVLHGGAPRRFRNLYGPTETTTLASWHEVDRVADGTVPIGRAVPRTRLHVLDASLRPVPEGELGELYVGGDGLGPGYVGRPGLTATRYLPEPGSVAGQRMYRTGDLVRALPGGALVFCGRRDRQVKLRGYRIELEEVEATLAGCPGMSACAVELVPGPGGQPQLAAWVAGAGADEVRAHAAASLPAYMVPASITVLERLPVTAGGKVDREQLLGLARAPAVDEPGATTADRVARVWAEVLGVPRVARDRNFFDLGGTSLLLIELQAGLGEIHGRAPEIGELLAHVTVRAQAALLDGLATAPEISVPAHSRDRLRRRREALLGRDGGQ
jgi:amino acid adenylation domain-containing protein